MKVLVVEDDTGLADRLGKLLTSHQYQVELATDGEAGLSLVEAYAYDLVLLDLHLPKLNGIHFCHKLRQAGGDMPVLLMTAEETTTSKIAGLDAGADDYLIKPIDTDELLARIRALLRRGRVETSSTLHWGPVSLNPSNCEVYCHDQLLHLTGKEYGILELFLRNQHRIFSIDALIERFWSFEKMPSENAVRTHIKSLRRKLKEGGVENMLKTVYGLGYRLVAEPAEPITSSDRVATESTTTGPISTKQASVKSAHKRKEANTNPANTDSPQKSSLLEIWRRHQQKYLNLISHLEQVVPNLAAEDVTKNAPPASPTSDKAVIERSRQAIHTLKGALGSFGFTKSSKIAAKIEPFLLAAPQLSDSQCRQLSQLIKSLRQSLDTTAEDNDTFHSQSVATQPITTHKATDFPLSQWLVVDSDQTLAETLIRKASIQGIQASVATTLTKAQQAIAQQRPDIIMIDPRCDKTLEAGLNFLRSLTSNHPNLPIIVATEQDTLSDRVQILRSSNGCTFLQKPASADQILEHIKQSLANIAPPSASIIALDDDPQILQCLQQVLSPWGFQLTLASEPLQFWEAIGQVSPDLLILDLEMPEISGLEICQVIRSDPRLNQIPILFLSAHTEPKAITQVFESGADDYVSKPIVASELVARILNRLERLRLLRALVETDGLTGLSSRRQSVIALNRLLTLAARKKTTLCLAVVDIDNFKQVNDHFGHEVGDRVLKTFGDYLRRAFRGEDVTARWGGEEFIIGFYDSSQTMAAQRLSAFLKTFNQHTFTEDIVAEKNQTTKIQQSFQVSFSAGIAAYPTHGETIQTLYRRADLALYRAKSAGRNQVISAEA